MLEFTCGCSTSWSPLQQDQTSFWSLPTHTHAHTLKCGCQVLDNCSPLNRHDWMRVLCQIKETVASDSLSKWLRLYSAVAKQIKLVWLMPMGLLLTHRRSSLRIMFIQEGALNWICAHCSWDWIIACLKGGVQHVKCSCQALWQC